MLRATLDAHVVELALLSCQAGFDVAQALAVAQLRERHGAKLVLTGEALDVAIALIALHAATKAVLGNMLQHLRENEFA